MRPFYEIAFGESGEVASHPVVLVMAVTSGLLTSGVVLISPVLSELVSVFIVTGSEIGLIITAFTAPQIVFVLFMGVVADRIGRKPVLIGGLITFGLSGATIALVDSFILVLALRFIQGISFSAVMPLTVAVIGDLFSGLSNKETVAQSLRSASNGVGFLLFPPIAGVLIIFAWEYIFLIYFITIPLAVLIWVTIPPISPNQNQSLDVYFQEINTIIRQPKILGIISSFPLRFVVLYGYLTYISLFASRHTELSNFGIGLIVGLQSITSLLGSLQAGRLSQYWHPALVLIGGFLLGGTGMVLIGFLQTLPAILLGTISIGVSGGIMSPVQRSLLNHHLPDKNRGGGIAVAYSVQGIGKAITPIIMAGVLTLYNLQFAFVTIGLIGLLAALPMVGTFLSISKS